LTVAVAFQDSDAGMLMSNKKSRGKRISQIGTSIKSSIDGCKESKISAAEIMIEQVGEPRGTVIAVSRRPDTHDTLCTPEMPE
jgi:hypothetical protein